MENRRTWLAVLAVAGFVALSYVAVSSQLGQSEALKAFEVDEEAFRMFIAKYGKTYTSEEYQRRFQIYRDNMAYTAYNSTQIPLCVSSSSSNAHNPKLTLGETPFVDLTHEEFTAQYLSGYKHQEVSDFVDLPTDTLPASVDWVMAGAVTPVKNQGQCGSCWAFSITGSIEGIHYLTTKDLVSLSEQQLVDCSWESPYDNYGCNGGYLGKTFQYVVDAGGLETEASYPYTALEGECAADKSSFAVSIKSYANVWSMSETALMAAVAQQPVSVAVDASEWLYYTQGIIDMCGSALNHAVLAVGYGTATDGTLYWLVKNSWGPYWGEDGYVRILRDPTSVNGGVCGIAIRASYPTV